MFAYFINIQHLDWAVCIQCVSTLDKKNLRCRLVETMNPQASFTTKQQWNQLQTGFYCQSSSSSSLSLSLSSLFQKQRKRNSDWLSWYFPINFVSFLIFPPYQQSLEYTDCVSYGYGGKIVPKKGGCPGYDTKLHLMGECKVLPSLPFLPYSLGPEVVVPLRVPSLVQIYLFVNYLEYLISFKHVQKKLISNWPKNVNVNIHCT